MATGNKCSQLHTNSPHHHGSALHSPRDTLNDAGSPSTHTPGARTCSCPLAEEDAEEGNQQMLEPGPMSVKPPVLTDGLPGPPLRALQGHTASADHGCPALGPPASSEWPGSFTQVTDPWAGTSTQAPFSPGAHVPESSARFMGRPPSLLAFCSGQSAP